MITLIAPQSGPVATFNLFNVSVGYPDEQRNYARLWCRVAVTASAIGEVSESGRIVTAASSFPGQNQTTHVELDGSLTTPDPWNGTSRSTTYPRVVLYNVVQPAGSFSFTHIIAPGYGLSFYQEALDVREYTSADVFGLWEGDTFKCACSFVYHDSKYYGPNIYQDVYWTTCRVDGLGRIAVRDALRYRIGISPHPMSGEEAFDYVTSKNWWVLNLSPVVCPRYTASGYLGSAAAGLASIVNARFQDELKNSAPVPNSGWGTLARNAYSQIQTWSGNGIAYLRDIREVRKQLEGLSDIVRMFGTAGKLTKAIATAYLTWHYGAKLTISDTKKLITEMNRYQRTHNASFRHFSSVAEDTYDGVHREFRYEAFVAPHDSRVSSLLGFLRDFDLLPTAENLWDLVPFSFVVDWFVNVGDILSALDLASELSQFEISYVGYSVKTREPVDPLPGLAGEVTMRTYRRWYRHKPMPPSIPSVSTPTSFDHWIEGSALVVQRITR